MKYAFHIVDVFSSTPFGGNQLAVLPDATGLSADGMQRIAREFNFPESTFVLPAPDDEHTYRVRIFTPLMLEAAKKDPTFQGHIVNTASMAGLLNPPAMGVYNVSKHAVVSLSETLYHDLGLVTEQVRCSVLCPYFVPTGISQSHRNRPAGLSNEAPPTRSQMVSQALSDKAVSSGKVTAADVAQLTFDAIRDESFYIYSHPQALDTVRHRMEHIIGQTNPGDAFGDKPEVRAGLVAALRG